MDVKGWLIIGTGTLGGLLAPPQPPLLFYGRIPNAADHPEGTVAVWRPVVGTFDDVTLVCVRLPIQPGVH